MYCTNFGREKYSKYISLLSFQMRSNAKPLSNFVLPFEMQIPFHLFEKSNLFIGRNAREKTNVPLTEKNSRKVHTLF